MKKLLLLATVAAGIAGVSGTGLAADLPVKAPMPAPLPPFSWTGFYIGGNIGGAWAHRDVTDTLRGLNFSATSDGVFIGGTQVGFNYQMGGFVLGVEGDFDWAGHNNSNNGAGVVVPGVGAVRVTANDKWIATLAARFGFAFDHWLLYGKAGGGWVGANNFTITNDTTGASISGGSSNSNSGFVVGAGIEYAITNFWTLKGEYDYLGLSNSRTLIIPVGALAGDVFTNRSRNVQMFKVGFNFLFNGARY
jgi:outer membrane immunogenic protein